jgi:hypothetical protein
MTRSVPLIMNVPLTRHERHFAEINFLFFDVFDTARAGLLSTSHSTSCTVTFSGAAKVMPR